MKVFLALVSLLFSLTTFSQDREEWLSELQTADDDSTKVALYRQLSLSYRGKDYNSAFYYARLGLELSNESNYPEGKVIIWRVMGTLHFYQSNYDSALAYYQPAYQVAVELEDGLNQGALLNNIGTLHNSTLSL